MRCAPTATRHRISGQGGGFTRWRQSAFEQTPRVFFKRTDVMHHFVIGGGGFWNFQTHATASWTLQTFPGYRGMCGIFWGLQLIYKIFRSIKKGDMSPLKKLWNWPIGRFPVFHTNVFCSKHHIHSERSPACCYPFINLP